MTELAHGIDVSNNNGEHGRIDWPAVAAAGVRFAWAKATEGITYHDPWFMSNIAGARAARVPIGGYHFARVLSSSAAAQAQMFRTVCPALDLPPMLDAEGPWFAGTDNNTDWCLSWFDSIGGDEVPVLYTNPYGLLHLDAGRLNAAGVLLFLARPTGAPDLAPIAGYPVSIVQYGIADVDGAGRVDVDAMPVDLLDRWTHPAPPAPPEDDEMIACMYAKIDGHPDVWVTGRQVLRPWRLDGADPGGFAHALEQAVAAGLHMIDPPASVYRLEQVTIGNETHPVAVIEAGRASEFGMTP